eukprot:scaffold2526_cov131-Cylindrotheca_fusiformis.AAC.5
MSKRSGFWNRDDHDLAFHNDEPAAESDIFPSLQTAINGKIKTTSTKITFTINLRVDLRRRASQPPTAPRGSTILSCVVAIFRNHSKDAMSSRAGVCYNVPSASKR